MQYALHGSGETHDLVIAAITLTKTAAHVNVTVDNLSYYTVLWAFAANSQPYVV